MKGRDLLRSAFNDVTERADCWLGAKAEAEARRAAAATNFIMVSFNWNMQTLGGLSWPGFFPVAYKVRQWYQ